MFGFARRESATREGSGGDCVALEVLVRRAVVALGERRALARLPLAGRRAAPSDTAVESARLDLLLDVGGRGGDPLVDGPCDLGLAGDREVAADVLEEGAGRVREIERILRGRRTGR